MIFSIQPRVTKTTVSMIIGFVVIVAVFYMTYQFLNPEISRETLEETHIDLLERSQELKQLASEIASNCNQLYSEPDEQITCHIEESEEIRKEMDIIANKIIEIDDQLERLEP